jgi:3-hydroxy acid dehydrogenase / malonic semialdehyde reductase
MNPLANKTVVITGASSGIGKACAYAFAGAGANLVLCARRVELLREIESDIGFTHAVETYAAQLDVRDRKAVIAWFDSIPEKMKPISVLVNNAGLAAGFAPVSEGDPDDWELMIDTNIKGLLNVTRAFMHTLGETDEAHIINIGSIAGIQAYANGAVYCATKSAVRFISDALRIETAGRNIRVTNVQPGLVETEFSIVRFHGDEARAKKVYEGIKPLSGGDIADAVLYAASAPPHVQIAEMTIMATHQASAKVIARKESQFREML